MYTFKTSERNNDKATEFETKSLLYLMTNAPNSDNVDLFLIDCFNDVTGVSADFNYSWDVQSKGVTSLTPGKIGAALYTLYANYLSDIEFSHYILFIPPVKSEYVASAVNDVFLFADFEEDTAPKVRDGLRKEITKRKDNDVIAKDFYFAYSSAECKNYTKRSDNRGRESTCKADISSNSAANSNAKRIVGLVKEGGRITGYQLSDSSIVEKQQAVDMAKQGLIAGVGIAHHKNTECPKSIPTVSENNNLRNLPSVALVLDHNNRPSVPLWYTDGLFFICCASFFSFSLT